MDNNFFNENKDEETKTEEISTEEPTLIKLGDKEFSQDELLQKVGLAEKVSELEGKYNTKLDSVWPEYGRSQTKVKELEARIAEMQTQKQDTGEIDPTTAKQALEAARKLGLLTKEDGVMTRAEFREAYMQERETDRLMGELETLEADVDGKDGRPKFEKISVLEHMKDTGIKNPMKAYKDMYETQLDEWKTKELSKSKGQGMYTVNQSSQGSKKPIDIKPTKDNLDQLVAEALEGNI